MTARGEAPAGVVQTYRGPVAPADLGWTLTHEHLFVRSPELDRDYPHPEWDADAAVETAVAGLEELYGLGVRTVVDLTVPGLGRDTGLAARVAARTRVHLVASTGWYADEVLPPYFRTHGPGRLVGGPDPLVEMFTRDVVAGIGDSGVRAGMLKVVTDVPGMTDDITRVMAAAATVHAATGVPITTHSNPHLRNGLDQARFLLGRGVAADHLVIGHSGDSEDLDYLLTLLDLGVTLGMDRFGMAHTGDDEKRTATVLALLERGHAGQLVLSHDAAYFSRVTPPAWRRAHTPHWTHDHLSRRVVPQLLERGARQEDLDTMMIHNAQRLLTPVVDPT
ncbi:phosphotriesterase family protein [Nocardioides sambongensis]|uniref:phosphotriesterase family protein n=1 Tax=Nocardioides sambongensis TaxID=2589074 RepID=UPI0015E866AF|nr:phosphotriesterase-related protein [Nocardioides sambongensis]